MIKNSITLGEFDYHLHKERGQEFLEKEDDINDNDWEFSLETLKWWEKKIEEIQAIQDN